MRFHWHIFMRSIVVRRTRSLTALGSILVAATVATALLNLYADTQSKLTLEFRRYGANAILQGDDLDPARVARLLRPDERAVPMAFATATDGHLTHVVVVGTDVPSLLRLNSYWDVEEGGAETAIGARAVHTIDSGSLRIANTKLEVRGPVAVFHSGDADESRVFVPLERLRAADPQGHIQLILLGIPGDPSWIESRIAALQKALPADKVEPVRQIIQTQAAVLFRMRSVLLFSTILIALIAALSLLASLSASVLERQKDFAVLKALGASRTAASSLFVFEALSIAVAGAVLGFALGCGISAWIGYWNFDSAVRPRLEIFPWILAGAVIITTLGAFLPLQRLQKIQPATMLKGE